MCSSIHNRATTTHEAFTQAFPRTRNGRSQTTVKELAELSAQTEPSSQTGKAAVQIEKNTNDAATGQHREITSIIFEMFQDQMKKALKASTSLHSHFHRLKSQSFNIAELPSDRIMRELLFGKAPSERYRARDIVLAKNPRKCAKPETTASDVPTHSTRR